MQNNRKKMPNTYNPNLSCKHMELSQDGHQQSVCKCSEWVGFHSVECNDMIHSGSLGPGKGAE